MEPAWSAVSAALAQLPGIAEQAPDEHGKAQGYLYLTRFLAAGLRLCLEHADPDYPTFGRMVDITMPWGADCPDCLYLYATVGAGRRYRIFGNIGTARQVDIQLISGHYGDGQVGQWRSLGARNLQELEVGADGSVEITVGGPEQPGNWLSSGAGAEFVQVRQYFSDWLNEGPADLLIEPLDVDYPVPPIRPHQIEGRLERLTQWLTDGARRWHEWSTGILAMPDNVIPPMGPPVESVGQRGQSYGFGKFACRPDEAVIIEFSVPRCRYWSVSLVDRFWETIDFATRQSSLNDSQGIADDDGVLRAVIAHADPGVANWLDPGGEEEGTIGVRYLFPEEVPTPTLRRVGLAELPAALPAGTARLSPGERAERLSARRRAVWRRYRR